MKAKYAITITNRGRDYDYETLAQTLEDALREARQFATRYGRFAMAKVTPLNPPMAETVKVSPYAR